MPAAVLAPIIGGAIAGGGAIAASAIQGRSAGSVARQQTEAANRAAELQLVSNREALAFQRQMAQNAYANSETARRGNYDQWAARERRLGSIGELLGYGSREVPGYVPGVDPRFDTGGSPAGPATPIGIPGGGGWGSPNDPADRYRFPGNYGGPPNTSDPTLFWPIDPATGLKRPPRPGEDVGPRIVGSDGQPVSRAMPVPYGSVGSYLQPPIHPGVILPDPNRYRMGPVGSYLR